MAARTFGSSPCKHQQLQLAAQRCTLVCSGAVLFTAGNLLFIFKQQRGASVTYTVASALFLLGKGLDVRLLSLDLDVARADLDRLQQQRQKCSPLVDVHLMQQKRLLAAAAAWRWTGVGLCTVSALAFLILSPL